MTFQITIQPSGYQFPIEEQETILGAALRHGYFMPYSCREGACGVCKGKVMEGEVDHGNYLGSALTNMDKAAGMTLFCCATPKSDLVVECYSAAVISNMPTSTLSFPFSAQKMPWPTEPAKASEPELPAGEPTAQP